MIEVDRRDDGGHRSYDVGRVQPAAQPDLDDRDLDRGTPEELERYRRRALEERRERLESTVADEAFDHVLDGGRRDLQIGGRHFAFTDDESFLDALQVWRGIPRRAIPGGVERRRGHRRHRPLAVGARRR